MRPKMIHIAFALMLSACANNIPQGNSVHESKMAVQSSSKAPTHKAPDCEDCLSQEDNEFLESISIPTPSLEDVLGPDGKPLK